MNVSFSPESQLFRVFISLCVMFSVLFSFDPVLIQSCVSHRCELVEGIFQKTFLFVKTQLCELVTFQLVSPER